MTRVRISIAKAMSVVLVVAVGFAALKDPSALWASACFTSAVVVLLASILGAVARRGRSRMAWFGSALFGGSYLVLCFGPWGWLNHDGLRPPPPLTTALLEKWKDEKHTPTQGWKSMAHSFDWEKARLSSGPSDLSVKPYMQTPDERLRFDISPYKQVAHSIGSLVFAAAGGCLGLAFTANHGRESQ